MDWCRIRLMDGKMLHKILITPDKYAWHIFTHKPPPSSQPAYTHIYMSAWKQSADGLQYQLIPCAFILIQWFPAAVLEYDTYVYPNTKTSDVKENKSSVLCLKGVRNQVFMVISGRSVHWSDPLDVFFWCGHPEALPVATAVLKENRTVSMEHIKEKCAPAWVLVKLINRLLVLTAQFQYNIRYSSKCVL